MNGAENKGSANDEAYVNAYYYFHNALVILAENAEVQCQKMGYFNVAWELKNDVISNGYAILDTIDPILSAQQMDHLTRLLESVADIPDSSVNVENSKEAHLRAMRCPRWIPLRAQAKQLLCLLEAETDRVNAILGVNR
ncbi:hypothetical protein [Methylovirgula sp. 4M-Z18]|uniref:hypothetical protein n=1 Tax=Methylovirgula sp. 4M-Z18 TaxID=2293567 RepID=UPI0011C02D15|nr:hypothetical protein [Methylovirgula sp. 4M-Z18]